ncbi:MAG: type II toxin-antitoxin system HipA family toxin [Kiritimatiellae bacterium]|nr:type II toxin-antitoxin system HipA family toxin [Kiritimatiellia bacterium]
MVGPAVRTGVLDVYLLGTCVGRIDYSSHHNEMRFAYAPEYLASSDAAPLSYSLPLQYEAFDSERTTVFFENLLPPSEVRRKLGPVLHLSRHNVFGFLEALGGDCAGAISLWPPDAQPNEDAERLRELSEDEADEILRSLRKRPLYVNGIDGYRISGAGAQSKLIARIAGGRISLPLYGTPSTHIIKPSVADYPDSVFNEAFSMRLAEQVGLKTARCGLMNVKGRTYYWTERYDRETVNGKIRRLHQEDFCQITGTSGELKYESEGGPTFAGCMAVMADMKIALADRLSFIDRMIFNYLIGNADAHGKNSSVLYRGRDGKSLAPVYDVMCTAVYRNLSCVNAMSIGGAKRFEDVSRQSFSAMAEEAGMRPQLILGRLDAMAKRILPEAQRLATALNGEWPSEVYAKIEKVIVNQLRSVGSSKTPSSESNI